MKLIARTLPLVAVLVTCGSTPALAGGAPLEPPTVTSVHLAIRQVGEAVVDPATGNLYVTAPLDD